MAKRMRLPNGFGQITKIKNKRLRKPFRAMVTVGKTEEGKPICKLLKPQAYFQTYNEAYAALLEYNRNPYQIEDNITMLELYERWSKDYFKTLTTKSSTRTIESAWGYCSEIYDVPVVDIRVRHIKSCIEQGKRIVNGELRLASEPTQKRIKSILNMMLDYAVEYDIIDRNYARSFNASKSIKKETPTQAHMPFKEEEICKLWNNVQSVPYVDALLIQCYTGLRPQELVLIRNENINLVTGTIIGGMKTESGTNRLIPIHPKIHHLIEARYDPNKEYLINIDGKGITYGQYRYRFMKILDKLGLDSNHKCHDPRMHFITMAKKYNVDEYAIKYIVGHSINDVTEKVYTRRDVDWLKEEIIKIK